MPPSSKPLRCIRGWAGQGVSLAAIARRLNEDSIPTKRGGRWHASTVRYLLRNALYEVAAEDGGSMSEPERLLKPEEVADRLGLSTVAAKAWMREGRLPSIKLGPRGLLRMREADLNAYIRGLAAEQGREP